MVDQRKGGSNLNNTGTKASGYLISVVIASRRIQGIILYVDGGVVNRDRMKCLTLLIFASVKIIPQKGIIQKRGERCDVEDIGGAADAVASVQK